uniref:Ribonuclease H1 n=1 Tax=Acrobeloides nanus TaxID=290746 RepID=A0A914C4B0_9BILA
MAFYAVARGFEAGVYGTWAECERQVKGYSKARFKKFSTRQEALDFIQQFGPDSNSVSSGKSISIATKRKFSTNETTTSSKKPSTSNMVMDSSSLRKMNERKDIPVVYTDGACSNNGRGGALAGFGVFWGDNHEDNVSKPITGKATNNRAEYSAVICALKQALSRGHTELIICTDSKLLINSVTKWIKGWQRNGWKTAKGEPVLNQDLLEEMNELLSRIKVEFQHVAGHAGIYGNEMADKLAREGAQQYSGS